MRVSFVIPAHDEEACLPATLRAIREVSDALHLDAEVIVADDASTDRTAEIAREHDARVVRHERRQISATRNLGAHAATGDVLFFVDADTHPSTEATRAALDALRAGAVGGGALVRVDGWMPLYARAMLALLIVMFRALRLAGGAFVFCTRQAWHESGGWDESLFAGEEIYFVRALKRRGRFVLVRPRVVTSARKLRTHSPREIFGAFARVMIFGRRVLRNRDALDVWYGPRREDPGG